MALLRTLWREFLGRQKYAMGSGLPFLDTRRRGAVLPDLAACRAFHPAPRASLSLRVAYPDRIGVPRGDGGARSQWFRFCAAAGLVRRVRLRFFPKLMVLHRRVAVLCYPCLRPAHGFGGMFGRILSQPLLQYIGRISYGIYVIHYPVIWLGHYLYQWFPQPFRHSFLLVAACVIVTLGLAMLSWHFIEGPINRRRSLVVAAVFKSKSAVKLERVHA
jgi:Acyltransferase family